MKGRGRKKEDEKKGKRKGKERQKNATSLQKITANYPFVLHFL